jgi:hypothetical protein
VRTQFPASNEILPHFSTDSSLDTQLVVAVFSLFSFFFLCKRDFTLDPSLRLFLQRFFPVVVVLPFASAVDLLFAVRSRSRVSCLFLLLATHALPNAGPATVGFRSLRWPVARLRWSACLNRLGLFI